MRTIVKISSLIILLIFIIVNVALKSQCEWTVLIDNAVEPQCNPSAPLCVEYDETLVDFYPNLNACEDVCFRVTLNYPIKTDLFIESTNGYDVVFPNTNTASAIVCFGQNSGEVCDLPFTTPHEIRGGDAFYKSNASVCTVMIEP